MTAFSIKGTATYGSMGEFQFTPNRQANNVAPSVETLMQTPQWTLRRSSRNFLVTFKLPADATRRDMERLVRGELPMVLGEIVNERF